MRSIYVVFVIAALLTTGCAPVWVAGTVAGAGAKLASDRRDAGTIIEDTAIEMRLTDEIYSDPDMGKKVRVNVTSYNGLVLLTGQVPNSEMRNQISRMARSFKNVREIYNEVLITDPIDVNDRTHDLWISSKVRTKLMANRGLFTRTKITTSNGIIYLMGLATPEEIKEATEVASKVEGVKSIVTLFEHYDSDSPPTQMVHQTRQADKPKSNTDKVAPEVLEEEKEDLDVVPFSMQPPPVQMTSEQ
jgi:osmotically-inducible protein OsmY